MKHFSFIGLILTACVVARPSERCGCAKSIKKTSLTNCGEDQCMSKAKGFCDGGRYGCPKTKGMCPLPGYYRDGYCYEPYGTHKVCASTNANVLSWFKSVGNDLSSVVAPGMGWCLCKHWTRGAICCHGANLGLLGEAFDWAASDETDEDVQQIRSYVEGKISKQEMCCDPEYQIAGCPSVISKTCAGYVHPKTKALEEEAKKKADLPVEPRKNGKECNDPIKKEVVRGTSPWPGKTAKDFFDQYDKIFKSNNRNAASHRWATFLLERSENMTETMFKFYFSSFCPVSGSIVYKDDMKRYGMKLADVSGPNKHRFGYMYFCCSPCVCDTQAFIRVDTKTVSVRTSKGMKEMQYWFTVISNPCENEAKLTESWPDPWDGKPTTLFKAAPELKCVEDPFTGKKQLDGAVLSDHGYPIIGMLMDSVAITGNNKAKYECTESNSNVMGRRKKAHTSGTYTSECEFKSYCQARAKRGFDSGMGLIFQKVANIGEYRCPEGFKHVESGAESATKKSEKVKTNGGKTTGKAECGIYGKPQKKGKKLAQARRFEKKKFTPCLCKMYCTELYAKVFMLHNRRVCKCFASAKKIKKRKGHASKHVAGYIN